MNYIARDIANTLNSAKLQYGDTIPLEMVDKAVNNNIIIAYGYSDDSLIFEGAISDQLPTTVHLIGTLVVDYELSEAIDTCRTKGLPIKSLEEYTTRTVKAIFDPPDYNASWVIEAEDSHPFRIEEDGELFCIGAVFAV